MPTTEGSPETSSYRVNRCMSSGGGGSEVVANSGESVSVTNKGINKTETTAIQTYWPPNRGFLGTPKIETLQKGTFIDRYGSEYGSFVSPKGTPFEMRALPPEAKQKPYSVYEVIKPIDATSGKAAPWFGQPGMGTQYEFNKSIKDLINEGVIRRVK